MALSNEIIVYSLDFMLLYKNLHLKEYASSARTGSSGWKPEFYKDKADWALKKTIALTNKLNKDNFQELCKNFHSLYIGVPTALPKMIDEIYKKALLSASYMELYIKLVHILAKNINSTQPIEVLKKMCLDRFKTEKNELSRLDNITFIANMTKLEFFKANVIIRSIIPDLLDSNKIEELCKLLDVAHIILKKYLKNRLDEVIEHMLKKVISKREKFMIEDLKDKIKKLEVTNRWGKNKQSNSYSSRKRHNFRNNYRKNTPPKKKEANPWKPRRLRNNHELKNKTTKDEPKEESKVSFTKVKETLLEYVDNSDKKEVIICFNELNEKDTSNILLGCFITIISQRISVQKELSNLIKELFYDKFFTDQDYEKLKVKLKPQMSDLMEEFPLTNKMLNNWNSFVKDEDIVEC